MSKTTDTGLQEITEGATSLIVPTGALRCITPPKDIAFYNPKAVANRDVSIAAYAAFLEDFEGPHTILEPLAGVGARGLRVANEAGKTTHTIIYQNDINPKAVELAKRSAKLNGLYSEPAVKNSKCTCDNDYNHADDNQGALANNRGNSCSEHGHPAINKINNDISNAGKYAKKYDGNRVVFSCDEACRFLSGHTARGTRGAIVDIDPFGSPAPFFDCATRAVMHGGMISCTATDLQVLNGLFDTACHNRYGGTPIRGTTYGSETAIRLVLGCLRTVTARLDVGIRPLFVSAQMHYYRMYVQVLVGHAGNIHDEIGHISHCDTCGNREISQCVHAECVSCGSKTRIAGPLWVGRIFDKPFVEKMREKISHAAEADVESCSKYNPAEYQIRQKHHKYKPHSIAQKIIEAAAEESGLQAGLFYTTDEMASRCKASPPRITQVIKDLCSAGYAASPTSFAPTGFRTDAPFDKIRSVFDQDPVNPKHT